MAQPKWTRGRTAPASGSVGKLIGRRRITPREVPPWVSAMDEVVLCEATLALVIEYWKRGPRSFLNRSTATDLVCALYIWSWLRELHRPIPSPIVIDAVLSVLGRPGLLTSVFIVVSVLCNVGIRNAWLVAIVFVLRIAWPTRLPGMYRGCRVPPRLFAIITVFLVVFLCLYTRQAMNPIYQRSEEVEQHLENERKVCYELLRAEAQHVNCEAALADARSYCPSKEKLRICKETGLRCPPKQAKEACDEAYKTAARECKTVPASIDTTLCDVTMVIRRALATSAVMSVFLVVPGAFVLTRVADYVNPWVQVMRSNRRPERRKIN